MATRIQDRKLRIIAIPTLALLIAVCFNLFYTLEFNIPFWKVLFSNLVYVACAVECTRLVVLYANRFFPEAQQTARRITAIIIALLLLAPLLGVAHIHFEKDILFGDKEPQSLYNYLAASGSTFFFTLIIAAVYEAWYFFLGWRRAAKDKETFEKASMEAQYELLKSQVQPHFLFNSLNSLISLVDEDTKRAKKFIRELSFVYRYLLQSNMQSFITLQEELAFITAYQYLLQTRFEEGLLIQVTVDAGAAGKLLPPLTLQLLVENAVKHNCVEREHPLLIEVFTNGNQLVVQNNIQRKAEPVHSSRIGLSNIAAKYASLRLQQQVIIEEKANQFMVSIPLIAAEHNGGSIFGNKQKQSL